MKLANLAQATLAPVVSGQFGHWLTIGAGERWEGVLAESEEGREFTDTGNYQNTVTQRFMGGASGFRERYPKAPEDYEGETAKVNDGETTHDRRVTSISVGEAFVTITLEGSKQAP